MGVCLSRSSIEDGEKAPLKHVTCLKDACYVSKDSSLKIAEKIYSLLGEKDEVKE